MDGAKNDWDEPWQVSAADPWYVELERNGDSLAECCDSRSGRARDMPRAARIVAEHNFLLGVPTARLTAADPAACMLLACLRGADQEAACYADEVIARATAPVGFVEGLERRIGELEDAVRRIVERAEDNARQNGVVWVGFVNAEEDELRRLVGRKSLAELRAEVPGDA